MIYIFFLNYILGDFVIVLLLKFIYEYYDQYFTCKQTTTFLFLFLKGHSFKISYLLDDNLLNLF